MKQIFLIPLIMGFLIIATGNMHAHIANNHAVTTSTKELKTRETMDKKTITLGGIIYFIGSLTCHNSTVKVDGVQWTLLNSKPADFKKNCL